VTDSLPDYKDVENKLIILYLINRLVLPMSREQITDVIVDGDLMDYYTLQQNLYEMVDMGLLESSQENSMENNITHFTATEEGTATLELFERRITLGVRQAINRYANENRKKIEKDYEKTATYFYDEDRDEFRIKCGVYEGKRALLELFISVDTREQAKFIQTNWQTNSGALYGKIYEALTTQALQNEQPPES
jgi:DNA-binding PadR family transcriptional regulator